MKKYFEVINLPILCAFELHKLGRFDLQTGIPNNAFEVYKSGFKNLGLKPGAEKLFKKESDSTIINLIRKARRTEDVEILALVNPENSTIQEEVKRRLAEFK